MTTETIYWVHEHTVPVADLSALVTAEPSVWYVNAATERFSPSKLIWGYAGAVTLDSDQWPGGEFVTVTLTDPMGVVNLSLSRPTVTGNAPGVVTISRSYPTGAVCSVCGCSAEYAV